MGIFGLFKRKNQPSNNVEIFIKDAPLLVGKFTKNGTGMFSDDQEIINGIADGVKKGVEEALNKLR